MDMNIEETREQSRNELGTRREAKRGRYKKKLTDEDYMGMEEYDFKLFTVQDYKAYKEILQVAPYNWELMKFFHEQYLEEARRDITIRRHTSGIVSFDEIANYVDNMNDPLNSMIKSAEEKARWSELKSAASSTAFERVMAYRVGKVSQTNIAKRENRNRVTIVRSISKAEIAIRAKALQMILDKRFPGIILKAEDTNERGDNNGDQ